jgi:hypothetical protein
LAKESQNSVPTEVASHIIYSEICIKYFGAVMRFWQWSAAAAVVVACCKLQQQDRELICGMSKWHSCTCYHTCSHSPRCSCHQTTTPPKKKHWEQKFVNPKSCTIIVWEKYVNPKSHTKHWEKFV